MKRCLILGCSETKVATPDNVPAIDRYDGPPFRVLRRFLADRSPMNPKSDLDVFILSAQFGLIRDEQPIPIYDRHMSGSPWSVDCTHHVPRIAVYFSPKNSSHRIVSPSYDNIS